MCVYTALFCRWPIRGGNKQCQELLCCVEEMLRSFSTNPRWRKSLYQRYWTAPGTRGSSTGASVSGLIGAWLDEALYLSSLCIFIVQWWEHPRLYSWVTSRLGARPTGRTLCSSDSGDSKAVFEQPCNFGGVCSWRACSQPGLWGTLCWVPWLLARLPVPQANVLVGPGSCVVFCRPQVTFGPAPEELMLDTTQVASWLFCRKLVTYCLLDVKTFPSACSYSWWASAGCATVLILQTLENLYFAG